MKVMLGTVYLSLFEIGRCHLELNTSFCLVILYL